MGITSTSAVRVRPAAVGFVVLAKGVPVVSSLIPVSKGLSFGHKCRFGEEGSEVEVACAFHPGAECSEIEDLKQSKRNILNVGNL